MKTILVPTDFSENAFIAAQYAAELALKTNSKLHLYHVYIVLYSGFKEEGASVSQIEWADGEASNGMEKLSQALRTQYPDLQLSTECVRGFLIDELSAKLKSDTNISMLVMGTKGATNVSEAVFGSTTFEVIKKSTVPVLVVPHDTGDFSMDRVGLFSDFQVHEIDALKKAKELLTQVNGVEVVHFSKIASSSDAGRREVWFDQLQSVLPANQLTLTELEVDKVDVNALSSVANQRNLDLLVFTRPHKSFFERIFGVSVTKAAAHYPIRPSLFIRE
jgi:nucleotide-binding universal stress UspA family protein